MEEEWRPVPGYEGLYEVSNTGKVRSISRTVNSTRRTKGGPASDFTTHRSSKELQPYHISKKGRIKYHLHKRIAPGMGSHTQTDEYRYVDELIHEAFDT